MWITTQNLAWQGVQEFVGLISRFIGGSFDLLSTGEITKSYAGFSCPSAFLYSVGSGAGADYEARAICDGTPSSATFDGTDIVGAWSTWRTLDATRTLDLPGSGSTGSAGGTIEIRHKVSLYTISATFSMEYD